MSPTSLAASVTFSVAMRISPRPSIASRALTARLRIAFSSWCGIDVGRPGVAVEIDLDADALAQRAVEQVGHAADQLDAVDALGKQRLGAGEGQQAAGQGRGAGRALHRVVEVDHHFAPRAVEAAPGKVDAADDHRQHIVEVVGDAAGQLADRLHLLDLAELGFGRLALVRLGLERLVGLPQFLGPVAHRLLERLGALGLAFGLRARRRRSGEAPGPRPRRGRSAPRPTMMPSQLR